LAIRPRAAVTLLLIGVGSSGCSLSRSEDSFARLEDTDMTSSISQGKAVAEPVPTDSDLAFARNAASDILTKGDKDSSQSWENPATGARGSVTPLAQSYTSDGQTCRDFLASYVNGRTESWSQGAGCRSERGRWQIRTMKPWQRS